MEKDSIFEMAERYVKLTGRSIFLTGKAGTGKTTFLKYITRTTSKRFVVLAPTGVAAVNAGGSTIHSFFLLPLCPYLPDVKELVTEYQMPDSYRSLRKDRVKILRTLDLIIIDEISMVRADLLDAVDMTLRRYRRSDKPFGGVQLLMIGDARQLSPVVKESERQYMEQVYPSPYFFHSKALRRLQYITIEFEKVYRQQDLEFLDILNAVRENRLEGELLRKLNSRVGAACGHDNKADDPSEPIRLMTHNRQADDVNSRKLDALPGEAVQFAAEVEGDFPENSYPADEVLVLKKGSQVMFIRNDSEGRFYNGKIGRVESFDSDDSVTVSDADGNLISVQPVEWQNIKYALDEEFGEIKQNIIGQFRQLPLRIAWAITIHKSQGLTFDRVTIDAGAAFAFGQVYVALSRCRTLEGISLDSPISPSAIYSDSDVSLFDESATPQEELQNNLQKEETDYRFSILREIFAFDDIGRSWGWMMKIWREHLHKLYVSEYQLLENKSARFQEIRRTGRTFNLQLSKIEDADSPDDDYLKVRLEKAAKYFLPELEEMAELCSRVSSLEIDNKEVRKKIKDASDELAVNFEIACRTMHMIIDRGFATEEYSKIRTEALLEDRKKPASKKKLKKIVRKEGEAGIVDDKVREKLMEWRTARFKADNVPAYTIMHQSTLLEIASIVPKSKEELLAIKGFGKAKFEKYGEEILSICRGV